MKGGASNVGTSGMGIKDSNSMAAVHIIVNI